MEKNEEPNIIIYNTDDGKVSVTLLAKDGNIWMNQLQLSELFDTSVPNISMHISNILKENELNENAVVKDYLTTAADGKNYNVRAEYKKQYCLIKVRFLTTFGMTGIYEEQEGEKRRLRRRFSPSHTLKVRCHSEHSEESKLN